MDDDDIFPNAEQSARLAAYATEHQVPLAAQLVQALEAWTPCLAEAYDRPSPETDAAYSRVVRALRVSMGRDPEFYRYVMRTVEQSAVVSMAHALRQGQAPSSVSPGFLRRDLLMFALVMLWSVGLLIGRDVSVLHTTVVAVAAGFAAPTLLRPGTWLASRRERFAALDGLRLLGLVATLCAVFVLGEGQTPGAFVDGTRTSALLIAVFLFAVVIAALAPLTPQSTKDLAGRLARARAMANGAGDLLG